MVCLFMLVLEYVKSQAMIKGVGIKRDIGYRFHLDDRHMQMLSLFLLFAPANSQFGSLSATHRVSLPPPSRPSVLSRTVSPYTISTRSWLSCLCRRHSTTVLFFHHREGGNLRHGGGD